MSKIDGSLTASFVYNAEGLRVQKTVNGVVTKYILHGKNITHLIRGNDELHFFYDASGSPAMVEWNNGTTTAKYAYVKNLQGDIIAIIDDTGVEVVKYTYDAWGTPVSTSGTMAGTLGVLQPFRYRGYVYDVEMGIYYLNTRFYNLVWNRFVNTDKIIENSLYTYCDNNPVSNKDFNGTHTTSCSSICVDDAGGGNSPTKNRFDEIPEGYYQVYSHGTWLISTVTTANYIKVDYNDSMIRSLTGLVDNNIPSVGLFDEITNMLVEKTYPSSVQDALAIKRLLTSCIQKSKRSNQMNNFIKDINMAEEKKSGILIIVCKTVTSYFGGLFSNGLSEEITFWEYNRFVDEQLDNHISIIAPYSN